MHTFTQALEIDIVTRALKVEYGLIIRMEKVLEVLVAYDNAKNEETRADLLKTLREAARELYRFNKSAIEIGIGDTGMGNTVNGLLSCLGSESYTKQELHNHLDYVNKSLRAHRVFMISKILKRV